MESIEIVMDEMFEVFTELLKNRFRGGDVDSPYENELKGRMENLILQAGRDVTREFHEEVLSLLGAIDARAKDRFVDRLQGRGLTFSKGICLRR